MSGGRSGGWGAPRVGGPPCGAQAACGNGRQLLLAYARAGPDCSRKAETST